MLTFSTELLEPISVDQEGIVFGRAGAFGIGTLLVLRCPNTHGVLMARKSYRKGFEGSNQFAFPGGMLRANGALDFEACLETTLQNRVLAEAGVSIQSVHKLIPLDQRPPVVGRYTIRGRQLVSTSILPFYGETDVELPASTNDATVHSVGWYDPIDVMHEMAQTNALILAQALWAEWSIAERAKIKPILVPHFEAVTENAKCVGAMLPLAPWRL